MVDKFAIYDRFDQVLDTGINIRMSEISALLCYSVITETEAIIANKYGIAEKYITACDKYDWEYINPISNGQRSNLYKFILLSRSISPTDDFSQIKTRTSPVYDYALGRDLAGVKDRHMCLPIWYELEDKMIDRVVSELEKS